MTDHRLLVLVTGLPGSGKTTLAKQLATALGLPLLSKDTVKEALFDSLGVVDRQWSLRLGVAAGDVVWSLVAESPIGAVVDAWVPPERDRNQTARGLTRANVEQPMEVFCDCPAEIAVRRYAARATARHPGHLAGEGDALTRIRVAAATLAPLGFGPALRVDTSESVELPPVLDWLASALPADPVRGDSHRDTPSGPRRSAPPESSPT